MKYLYITILCFGFLFSNAQVAPLLEHDYWTIEKVVIDNDTTYADTNFFDEYEKLEIEGFDSSNFGLIEFIIFDSSLQFYNTNQSFEMLDPTIYLYTPEEGITDAGQLLIYSFFVDEDLLAFNPFTYAFREEDDKIYLDITNNEGSVATFWTSTLSTPNFQEIEFSFYPNPVKDLLHIESPQSEIQKIQIFDMNGKQVLQSDLVGQETIDVSQLKSGVYLLQVETRKVKATRKLVKE